MILLLIVECCIAAEGLHRLGENTGGLIAGRLQTGGELQTILVI